MKVLIQRKALLRLIDRCLPATTDGVPGHGRSILLMADKDPDELRASAVGMTLAIDTCQPAKVLETGQTVVEAPKFRSLVEALPDEEVALRVTAERVTVSAKSRRYSMAIFGPNFPAVPDLGETATPYRVPTDALGRVLSATAFAMDDAQGHEHLNGVLLGLEPGQLRGVALCGSRGAHCSVEAAVTIDPVRGPREVFVPAILHRSLRALCEETKSLRVDFDGHHVYFENDDTLVVALLPNASFPNWRAVMDKDAAVACTLDGPALLDSVRAMLTAASQPVVMELDVEERVLRLSLPYASEGEGSDELPVTVERDASLNAAFNTAYLAKALTETGVVTLSCAGELEPLWIASQDKRFYALIMPLRLQGPVPKEEGK